MNALAVSLSEEHQYAEAEALEPKVLETQKRVLGPRHPHIAGTLYNLGCIEAATGKLDEAFSLLRQAIDTAPLDVAASLERENGNDLASLRKDPRFPELMAYAKESERNAKLR